jgi:hypothetical protein
MPGKKWLMTAWALGPGIVFLTLAARFWQLNLPLGAGTVWSSFDFGFVGTLSLLFGLIERSGRWAWRRVTQSSGVTAWTLRNDLRAIVLSYLLLMANEAAHSFGGMFEPGSALDRIEGTIFNPADLMAITIAAVAISGCVVMGHRSRSDPGGTARRLVLACAGILALASVSAYATADPGGPRPSPTIISAGKQWGCNKHDIAAAYHVAYKLVWSGKWNWGDQFGDLSELWLGESGWCYKAVNDDDGGHVGIPQAAKKYYSDARSWLWQNSIGDQIKWGLWYIKRRYGDIASALAFKRAHNWY